MTEQQHKAWDELMYLIAQYDWAVEGMPCPPYRGLTTEQGVQIRNNLVALAKEMTR